MPGISRPTLNSYLDFLEKTYVIGILPAHAGPDRATVLGKNVFFCDNGIARVLSHPGEGALFENAVFNQLKHRGALSFLSRSNQYEIDFILEQPGSSLTGFEVSLHTIRKVDLRLKERAQAHGLDEAWLVGREPTPEFEDFFWGGSIF